MHINMKYYIVTIGAIFIALGIGIIVGFNLNYDQELSKQQTVVINDLDKKFEELKTTNDDLENSLGELNKDYDEAIAFINQNKDKIIVDVLAQRNIGIISTNENNDYNSEIKNTLEKANANLAFDITIKDKFIDKSNYEELSTNLNTQIKSSDDLINLIVASLNSEEGKEKLKYLNEANIIEINSLSDTYNTYESIVIAGGSESKEREEIYQKLDKVLIPKLKENNKYIVGVQGTNVKFSYIDLFKEEKISTIDNIDEGIGKISLVLELENTNVYGNYGRLESADSLMLYKK